MALLGLVVGWLAWSRVRSSDTAGELLRHLPADAQIYAFLDVDLMRRTGVLERLVGTRASEDPEYRQFVAQSGFNYRQHLDAALMARHGTAQYAVLAGRFDGPRLEAYALKNAGVCTAKYCYVPGAPPISFVPIRPGLYAFASGTGDARELLASHAPAVQGDFIGSPVWATGLGPTEVPLLQALPGVERCSLWLTPLLPAVVELRFALDTRDAKAATATARELTTLSKAGELARHLTGAEASAEGKRVNGRLPVPLELLESLASGTRLR